jgi:hypothetical protein
MKTPARILAVTTSLTTAALVLGGCSTAPSADTSAAEPSATASATTSTTPTPAPSTASASPEPEVERVAEANDQACIQFSESHNVLADLLTNGKGELALEDWRQAQRDEVANLDKASLSAEGEIAERMAAAVALIPIDPIDMVGPYEWRIGDEYNRAIVGIYTACEVGGVAYRMKELELPPEILRSE